MTPHRPPPTIDRLYDLLAEQATAGLSPGQLAELRDLLAKWPHVDPNCLDEAAAAAQLAAIDDLGPDLPLALMTRLEADAAAQFRPAEPRPKAGARWFAWAGWATAACLLVGLGWVAWPRPKAGEPTLAQKRDALRGLNSARFATAAAPGRPAGEVVWNRDRQEGYIEVRGLPPNDPARRQYQLWVVDKGRPHKEPVDGGVFDVDATGSALVPVRSPLVLREPAAFAVTDEPAGGVVVSESGKKGEFVVLMTPVTP